MIASEQTNAGVALRSVSVILSVARGVIHDMFDPFLKTVIMAVPHVDVVAEQ